jgi:hypothetical protein
MSPTIVLKIEQLAAFEELLIATMENAAPNESVRR